MPRPLPARRNRAPADAGGLRRQPFAPAIGQNEQPCRIARRLIRPQLAVPQWHPKEKARKTEGMRRPILQVMPCTERDHRLARRHGDRGKDGCGRLWSMASG